MSENKNKNNNSVHIHISKILSHTFLCAHTHTQGTQCPELGSQRERQQTAGGWGGTSGSISSYGLFSLGSRLTQPGSAGVWI